MRKTILLLLLVITPLGFYSKFYAGPGAYWVNNSLGGVLYEIFWCCAILFLVPKAKPLIIAAWVLALTCFLETLQLWHPPFLQAIRKTFIGQTLIGTSFVWTDFIYYVTGCCIGYISMRIMQWKKTAV